MQLHSLKDLYRRSLPFLEGLQLRLALKIGVAASLGLFVGVGFSQIMDRPDTLVSGMWTVVTAIVVVQAHLGSTYLAAWARFLGTLIGIVMAGLCTTFLGSNVISLGFSNFATVALCSLFRIKESVRIASLTVTVLMILWRLKPEISPWAFGFFRLMDSCLGIIVAVIVTHTLFPQGGADKLRECLKLTLKKMRLLYRDCLFKSALSQEKREEESDEWKREIAEHIHEARVTIEETKSEFLTRSPIEDWNFYLDHVERAYEAILDLRDIKKSKSSDYIYSIFRKKIKKTIEEIDLALEELTLMMEKKEGQQFSDLPGALSLLNEELEKFKEGSFDGVKRVEELQNLFVFIYSLRSLLEELSKLKTRATVL